MQDDKQQFLRYLGQTTPFPAMLEVAHAEGPYIIDRHGKKYLDFISGIGVSNLGHNHPKIRKAIHLQTDRYLHVMVYGEYVESPQVSFARSLIELLPPPLESVYFVNSGSEATETAMKLAKRVTGRPEIVHCVNSYHGSTQGALSVAGNQQMKSAFYPLLPGIQSISHNSIPDLTSITDRTAAVIIEPIQGEGGIQIPDKGYLQALRERCNETGTLLIFDEIQSGFGRTGKLFAFEHEKVIPDILLTGKAMGGGLPLAGVIASRKLLNAFTHNPMLGHITTFGGHPLCCAAAEASLKEILALNPEKSSNIAESVFREHLNHERILEVRGKGWFWAVETGSEELVTKVCKQCREKGLIVDWFLFCPTAIRLAPPINVSREQMISACKILVEVIDECG